MAKRVAVFGGSFSPVHIGHARLASAVIRKGLADEVWLMPCRRNPLKANAPQFDEEKRLGLLHKAARYCNTLFGKERIKVSELELTMPEPSFTADTMRRLMAENPDVEFRLLVGADSCLDFSRWREWEWLERNFAPIVYPRPGYALEGARQGWTLLEDVEQTDVSSTLLREMMAKGEDPREFMPWVDDRPQGENRKTQI